MRIMFTWGKKSEYEVIATECIHWVDTAGKTTDRATLFYQENAEGKRKVTYTKSSNPVEDHSYWHDAALPWIHGKTSLTAGLKHEIDALKRALQAKETRQKKAPPARESDSDEVKRLKKQNKKLMERLLYYEKS